MKEGKWKQGNASTSILGDQPKRNKSHFQKYWFGSVSDQPEYLAPVLYQESQNALSSLYSFSPLSMILLIF